MSENKFESSANLREIATELLKEITNEKRDDGEGKEGPVTMNDCSCNVQENEQVGETAFCFCLSVGASSMSDDLLSA